ncbi:hypothetical protein [Yimella sp. cx-51]|uniref:hypothetical protein n=1 Tax=Yimella sp. cx-51 TaxID=2770551 RepID=UPI00165E7F69|nr:hypothetical protein [Yimella sp. cx-51]MBC9956443.1 hypothetical protein [Yimella sp. cx-51]QTH38441.1 hypothetical protein J5M86_01820 [Yimella sp. cx-51]
MAGSGNTPIALPSGFSAEIIALLVLGGTHHGLHRKGIDQTDADGRPVQVKSAHRKTVGGVDVLEIKTRYPLDLPEDGYTVLVTTSHSPSNAVVEPSHVDGGVVAGTIRFDIGPIQAYRLEAANYGDFQPDKPAENTAAGAAAAAYREGKSTSRPSFTTRVPVLSCTELDLGRIL